MAVTRAARVIKMTEAEDYVTGGMQIYAIRWVKPTTDGDDLLISDTAGNEIFAEAAIANVGASIVFARKAFPVEGLVLTTLDSGTVYIYLEG